MEVMPDHTRVRSVPVRGKRGITTPQTIDGFYRVEWDDGSVTHEAPGMIEPEEPASSAAAEPAIQRVAFASWLDAAHRMP